MRNDSWIDDGDFGPTELDRRLRSLEPDNVPEDLLARCLGTIDRIGSTPGPRRMRLGRWISPVATSAAALILIGVFVIVARPRTATAASFLQAVRASWTEVPACHRVIRLRWPALNQTVETWFVRGKGGRQETRSGDQLTGVVVNNGRWEFRWDLAEHLVAAWSTSLLGKRSEFEHAGLIQGNEALVGWAEKHQADIRIEPDTLDGRKLRKVTLRWPGPGGAGSHDQVDTVWFDPDSLRPVRQHSEQWDGGVTESSFDYPAPENVPADLLTFQTPPDVTLEINDPDLGRQVYSEPYTTPSNPNLPTSKGAKP